MHGASGAAALLRYQILVPVLSLRARSELKLNSSSSHSQRLRPSLFKAKLDLVGRGRICGPIS